MQMPVEQEQPLNPMQVITSSLVCLTELDTQGQEPSNAKTKPHESETFNGSDPEKLQQF